MRAIHLTVLICFLSLFSAGQVLSQRIDKAAPKIVYESNVMVTMRDGIRLSANIYRPAKEGTYPVILRRTPYGSGDSTNADGHFFASQNYIFISQDTRGRFKSEGTFDAFRHEKEDGEDMHRWIAQQNWFNGKLGTQGGSYVGFTQWMPAPSTSNLRGMFTWVSFSSLYEALYHGGAFHLDFATNWSIDMTRPYTTPTHLITDRLMHKLPLIDQDSLWGWRIPFLRDWILHQEKDAFWNKTEITTEYQNISASVYSLGGWFDIFLNGTIDGYTKLAALPKKKARQRHKLVIGPWQHVPGKQTAGELDFGKDALIDLRQMQLNWFDTLLKKIEMEPDTLPPVRIFVMGKNQWRYENEWPIARTRYIPYFIGSLQGANSIDGDGTLSPVKSKKAQNKDVYTYNPLNPVYMPHTTGPYDQSEVERRKDVLVYTTSPLAKDIEVTGPVKMKIFVSTNALSTDFTAKLVDVHPNGKAIRICEGILRITPKANIEKTSQTEPMSYEIDLWATSNLFKKGHKIRVEISSSNYPKYFPNPNTNQPFYKATRTEMARQTIYHGHKYPSQILLPVIE
jgi:putative CocE/NonD family hydrolase